MSFHLLPYPPTQFVHHPNGGTKVICFLLSRDLEMRKDEGFLLVLIQVGVLLLFVAPCPKPPKDGRHSPVGFAHARHPFAPRLGSAA